MNLSRALWLALPLSLLLPVGCANSEPSSQTAETAVAATPANDAPAAHHGKHRRGHHGKGLALRMIHAAQSQSLSDAQKATIDTLKASLRGDGELRTERQALHTALVAGVRAGSIDTAKIAPLQAAIEKGMAAHRAKETQALNGLWAALDPAQRTALVASMRAKQAEWAGRAAEHRTEEKAAGTDFAARRLEHMTKDLDLDAAQQRTVEGLLSGGGQPDAAHWEAQKKHTEAVLSAFEGRSFDAAKIDAAPAPEGRDGMLRHVDFLTKLVPALRPEQREKLAASMEKPHGPQRAVHGEEAPEAPAE